MTFGSHDRAALLLAACHVLLILHYYIFNMSEPGPMRVQGTDTAVKNELLYQQFGINYAHLPEQFKKVSSYFSSSQFAMNRLQFAMLSTSSSNLKAHGSLREPLSSSAESG